MQKIPFRVQYIFLFFVGLTIDALPYDVKEEIGRPRTPSSGKITKELVHQKAIAKRKKYLQIKYNREKRGVIGIILTVVCPILYLPLRTYFYHKYREKRRQDELNKSKCYKVATGEAKLVDLSNKMSSEYPRLKSLSVAFVEIEKVMSGQKKTKYCFQLYPVWQQTSRPQYENFYYKIKVEDHSDVQISIDSEKNIDNHSLQLEFRPSKDQPIAIFSFYSGKLDLSVSLMKGISTDPYQNWKVSLQIPLFYLMDNFQCPIALGSMKQFFEEGEKSYYISQCCGHYFSECGIDSYRKYGQLSCPLCRKENLLLKKYPFPSSLFYLFSCAL